MATQSGKRITTVRRLALSPSTDLSIVSPNKLQQQNGDKSIFLLIYTIDNLTMEMSSMKDESCSIIFFEDKKEDNAWLRAEQPEIEQNLLVRLENMGLETMIRKEKNHEYMPAI